jgi:hypothetical protein
MYSLRTMKPGQQRVSAGCYVNDHYVEPTAQGTLLQQRLSVLQVTVFFQPVWMQQGTDLLTKTYMGVNCA